jgi:hypothetical protein
MHPFDGFVCLGKTGLSSFHEFNPLDRTYPSPILSLLTPNLSRTTVRVTPRPPLAIPWFLHGILEFLGEMNSPRIGVSASPTGFSPSHGIFT